MKKQVIAREGIFEIPFRGVCEEDVLPPLAPELTPRAYKIYPYRLQELYHPEHENHRFRTLDLENDFLTVTLIPELGGRMLAYDKKAKRDLFFRNTELTPVMVGLTGAWMRLGCEFNFPGSHSVTSNRPVSASVRTNPDGSGSIIFSDIEWCSGMEWKIELTLMPDSAVIRQTSTFYNRTQVHNRGYFWTNAKVEAPADSEFIFPPGSDNGMIHPPMDVTRIHTFRLPGDNGIDLGKNCNIVYPLPLFCKDLRTPFFGCFNRNEDAGMIHFAACGDLPGRKVWTPGVGDDAKPTAQGGPDTFEIQSGPLPLQTDFFYLEPGRCTSWNEYWIPFSGIGKVIAASPKALVGKKDGAYFLYAAAPLQDIRGDGIQVEKMAAGEAVQLARKPEGRITAAGVPVIQPYSKHDIVPEYEEAADMREDTAEAWVQKAVYRFSRGENALARKACEESLKIDPDESQALLHLGIDALKCGEPERAVQLLRRAKRRSRRDTMIDYYLGLALKRSGNAPEAEFFLERAMGPLPCRLAAAEVWAELLIAQDRGTEAEERLNFLLRGADEHLVVRMENLRLLELLLIRHPDSEELQQAVELLSPENPLLQCCRHAFHGTARQLLYVILDGRRRGADTADWEKQYLAMNPQDPTGWYLFGGEPGYAKAEMLPPDGVFPDSEEVFQLLKQCYADHPDSRLLPVYLGTLAASFEDWETAEAYWKKCGHLFAVRGIGLSALHKGDAATAAEYYLAGYRQAAGCVSYKYFHEMMLALRRSGDITERGKILSELPEKLVKYPLTSLARFQYLFDTKQYAELLEALKSGKFTLYEGKRDTVNLFIGSHLALGEADLAAARYAEALAHFEAALSYPLNLGVGRSAGRADLRTKYLICRTLLLQGKQEEAAARSREYLDEIKRCSYTYVPLKTIRYEEDNLLNDELLKQNLEYENKLKEFLKNE